MNNGTGVDTKISKSQIRKAVMEGGSLWSSLFSLGTKLLPYATKAVTKAVPPLATGALSGLANVGVDNIFGKCQVVGFLIPQNKVDQLIKYKDTGKTDSSSNSYRRTSNNKTKCKTDGWISRNTSCKYWCSFAIECINRQRIAS